MTTTATITNRQDDKVKDSVTSNLLHPENEKTVSTDNLGRPKINRKTCYLISGVVAITTILIIIFFSFKSLKLDGDSPYPNTQITEPTTTLTTAPSDSDADVFIPREKWRGVDAINSTTVPPATLVVVKHTGGPQCTNAIECSARVREIQKEHMDMYKYPDISYNFIIGGDGKIYIGRGYNVQNQGRNDSLDIAFIGNFSISKPSDSMLQSGIRTLIKGVAPGIGGINFFEYRVVSHNQTEKTDSPGKYLYKEVTQWRFYDSSIYFNE